MNQTEVRGGMPDGMAIGVTTLAPHEFERMPETVDELKVCWVVGVDGQSF